MNFQGKTILVTGASQGIGLQCAKSLLENGADSLVLTARNIDRLHERVNDLKCSAKNNVRIRAIGCDHADRQAIDKLISELAIDTGQMPSMVIANVGDNPVHRLGAKKIHRTDYDVVEQCLRTNTLHTFYLVSQLLDSMRRQRFGRIALIGTQAYQEGIPGQVAYNLSKSALVGLKNTIVNEYGKSGITCHLINPGVVENARTEKLRARFPELDMVSEKDVAEAVLAALSYHHEDANNGLELSI